jgi:hypothetical protein
LDELLVEGAMARVEKDKKRTFRIAAFAAVLLRVLDEI